MASSNVSNHTTANATAMETKNDEPTDWSSLVQSLNANKVDTSPQETEGETFSRYLGYKCNFGKYKGQTYGSIMRQDFGYFEFIVGVLKPGKTKDVFTDLLSPLKSIEEEKKQ